MSDQTTAAPSPAPLGRWPESKRPMGIGFMMPISDLSAYGGTPRFRDMLELTQVAEQLGYDVAWVPDHFVVRNPDSPNPWRLGGLDDTGRTRRRDLEDHPRRIRHLCRVA